MKPNDPSKEFEKKSGNGYSYFKEIAKNILDIRKNLVLLIIFFILIFINYLISKNLLGGEDFFIRWASFRNLFFKGIDPYSQDAINSLGNSAQLLPILSGKIQYHFLDPLFSLFFFFPFGIFSDFFIARALWMTVCEVVLLLSSDCILKIINWDIGKRDKTGFILFSIFLYYSLFALLKGSVVIILFYVFLLAVNTVFERKYISAGILFSILTIKLSMFILPVLVLIFYSLRKEKGFAIAWIFISLMVLSAGAYLLIPNWPVSFLREIIQNANLSGLAIPGILMTYWMNNVNPIIWNGIAVLFLGIFIFETILSDCDRQRLLWELCLSLAISPFIFIQNNLSYFFMMLFPFGLVFQQWIKRDKNIGSKIFVFSIILFSFILGLLGIVSNGIQTGRVSVLFYFLPVFYVLLNLYWIRGWLINATGIES
jgi:hypothetical protein